jgi:HEPN domain-containing protein
MNIIKEWITKAKRDLLTAERENEVLSDPNYDAVCFHSQQCIEKMLKAIMIMKQISVTKTHDLNYLYLQLKQDIHFPVINETHLRFLSRAAVAFRYPGEEADQEQASDSLQYAQEIYNILLNHFTELSE